jgi:hypothetical protein
MYIERVPVPSARSEILKKISQTALRFHSYGSCRFLEGGAVAGVIAAAAID